ncbi:hypothetical protein FISHEDRAFT_74565 [Fistulina hepatica ATCC 64428]|uniref:DNA/RNA polymerase n=1 Tax=Fistulina hepatica ATCC 64428 TaxID=1128425 RepID=A0A0D7A9V8_9AGAR|nr:hypothetical protein FISHEDRAFT_74565 [Fistulina hepatica ATCC 64428]
MPELSMSPIPFTPMGCYTQEHHNIINKVHEGDFLQPVDKKGHFREDFFPPVVMPVIAHTPWVLCNMPIPPGLYDKVIECVRAKIESGTYESSSSSYRSCWFTVLNKDGVSLHLVHNLQPLNAAMIQDSGVPPFTEQTAESMGDHACYGCLDLYVGYDERVLAPDLRDFTTFQTPLGTF